MKELIEKARKSILDYYWKTCYPNADEKEFTENWLKKNDNEAFVEGLVEIFSTSLQKDKKLWILFCDAKIKSDDPNTAFAYFKAGYETFEQAIKGKKEYEVCKNCKYFNPQKYEHSSVVECTNIKSALYQVYLMPSDIENFGCNQFESKEEAKK